MILPFGFFFLFFPLPNTADAMNHAGLFFGHATPIALDDDYNDNKTYNLAEIHRSLSSPRQAITFYEQAMQLQWAQRNKVRQSWSLYGLAHALRQLGQPQAAIAK